jgi:predicted transcriptional regulator
MIRRGLADELIDRHHLRQTEVAKLLGVTDSVISTYRCRKHNREEGMVKGKEYFDLRYEFEGGAIKLLNGIKVQTVICQICANIRESGLLDLIHEIITGTSSDGRYRDRFVVIG